MAINTADSVKALLKTYYKKEGVENLLFRNSPLLKDIAKERVEGKEYAYSAMYGRGGAVGGDFKKAKIGAAEVAKAAEFKVTPGQMFSVYTMNAQEVEASKTNSGAYMPIAGAKCFASQEAFRKTMAAALYGRGYGELCVTNYNTAINSGAAFEMTLPSHAIMAIDVGSKLVIKQDVENATTKVALEVLEINDNKVKFNPTGSYPSPKLTDVLCFDGSMKAGKPVLPIGLAGWLPVVGKRSSAAWTNYIKKDFFGVIRATVSDRLAGAFVNGAGDDKKFKTVEKLIQKCRRQGSMADMIVMNDEDFMDISAEIETTNTFFTQTSSTAKKSATVGYDKLAASFSTNYIDNIIDDPYCPKGVFYVLEKDQLKLLSYTNDVIEDGVTANNPGKTDPMEASNDGHEDTPYGLIIDDYLNVKPGDDTEDGPATMVSILFYGNFAIMNQSVCGAGIFSDAKLIEPGA